MYLYGASGHAKVIIDILEATNTPIDGLIDNAPKVSHIFGYAVGNIVPEGAQLLISIGNNKVRETLSQRYATHSFVTAIHPSAIISPRCHIGVGTVVMQGAIIQADAKIGDHVIINTAASIDHECTIGNFAHISPHATLCGNVTIGEGTWIGAGATIIPGVKVGAWSVIGAGSVVTKDIPDHVVAYGNNCKVISHLPSHE
jgi:sugar O-acyltransferase (sialic acid O-acetyltransferase NeuD family)